MCIYTYIYTYIYIYIFVNVVKKIDCSDRINALKLRAEPVSILIKQVYMPTSEYEDAHWHTSFLNMAY